MEALNKWREKGFNNKLVTLEIHNVEDADVLGNNPIYQMMGKLLVEQQGEILVLD